MNKLIIVGIVLITTLTSCKDYTCTCYITGGAYHNTHYISSVTNYGPYKSKASKQCAAQSINGQSCTLN
jgi:hypothetical protein